jgi:hypothetical protein
MGAVAAAVVHRPNDAAARNWLKLCRLPQTSRQAAIGLKIFFS